MAIGEQASTALLSASGTPLSILIAATGGCEREGVRSQAEVRRLIDAVVKGRRHEKNCNARFSYIYAHLMKRF